MEFFKSRYFYIGLLVTLVTVGAFLLGISFRFNPFNLAFWGATALFATICLYELGAIFWKPLGCLLPVLVLFMQPFYSFLDYRGKTIKRWSNVKSVNVEYYHVTVAFTDAVVGFDIYETIDFCPFLEKYKWSAKGIEYVQTENFDIEGLGETGLRVRLVYLDSSETKSLQPIYLGFSRYF